MKKNFLLSLGCLLLVCIFCAGYSSSLAASAASDIYRYYEPIHEISLVDKSEYLSVVSEILDFKFSGDETKKLPDLLSSTYKINNNGSTVRARIAVPFQGVPRSRDWDSFSLTVNGSALLPTVYFEKHHDIYHPVHATNKPFVNPADILGNAFGELYVFDSSAIGTFYEFSPIDLEENMSIDFHLTENQKLYENGYFSARLTHDGYLRVDKKNYDSPYNSGRYTAFVTSGELAFEATNATYVSYPLAYNDLIPIMKNDVSRYGNYKWSQDFHDEYFEIFASNYLNYITSESEFSKLPVFSVGGMLDWWINEYRYMYLVYEVDFAIGETTLLLERPIDDNRMYFKDEIRGYEINNAPIQNWASFGQTTINTSTSESCASAGSYSFYLKKTDDLIYTHTGNLSQKKLYGVYFHDDNFSGTWMETYRDYFESYNAYWSTNVKNNFNKHKAWMIPVIIVGGLCVLYLLISTLIYFSLWVKKRKTNRRKMNKQINIIKL